MRTHIPFALTIVVFLVWPSAAFSDFPEEPPHGELRLEGQFIQTLGLQKLQDESYQLSRVWVYTDHPALVLFHGESRQEISLSDPGGSVTLPVGRYLLRYVILEDKDVFDARFHYWIGGPIIIATDKPAVLKIGGPLTPMLDVIHRGNNLDLSYRLVGIGGETYRSRHRTHRTLPEYTVHKGNRPIASGSFEYG